MGASVYKLQPEKYPLVQQFVDGEDYCLTALFDNGTPVATMTYRNVRVFPRDTGAGALRETVQLPEAGDAARRLLTELGWHGMAELDFRVGADGTAYLIELNPRFFGARGRRWGHCLRCPCHPYLRECIGVGSEMWRALSWPGEGG